MIRASYRFNTKNEGCGIDLLRSLDVGTVDTTFFDPQYRGLLETMRYGDAGKGRTKARYELQQMSDEVISEFIKQIDRCLKPSGHLFLWLDKYHLLTNWRDWLEGTELEVVDMVTWDKGCIGMGYRTRRRSEYLIVVQKLPKRAKGVWIDRGIPDVWLEKIEGKKQHPHQKPIGLLERLIRAVVPAGGLVVDPAAGSFAVLDACRACGVDFFGCDLVVETKE